MAILVGLAILDFVATNLDDLVMLLVLFSEPRLPASHVTAGQFLGMGALTLVALAGSEAAAAVPRPVVGLLGFFPIAVGLRLLRPAFRDHAPTRSNKTRNILAAATLTVANGGDNVAAYVPLLAGRSPAEVIVVMIVFAGFTALWCGTALIIIRYSRWGPPIRRLGPRVLPWLYLGLGASILVEGRAYSLVFRQ